AYLAFVPGSAVEVDPGLGVDGVALADAEARHDGAALVAIERREEREAEQRVVALVGRLHVLEELLVALDQVAIRVQHAAFEFHRVAPFVRQRNARRSRESWPSCPPGCLCAPGKAQSRRTRDERA